MDLRIERDGNEYSLWIDFHEDKGICIAGLRDKDLIKLRALINKELE